MEWFKTYIKETLVDEKLEEMTLDEWGARTLLQCLLGRSKVTNFIYLINETEPTNDEKIANKLHVNLSKWIELKESMLKKGIINLDKNGAVGISKWAEHQSDYYRQKKYRQKTSEKTDELQPELPMQPPTKKQEKVISQVTDEVTHRIKNTELRSKNPDYTVAPVNQSKSVAFTDVQKIVLAYKVAKGFEFEDKGWDKLNFKRCSKSAKQLIGYFKDYRTAIICIDELSKDFNQKGLEWTIETIVKHASVWQLKKQGDKNANTN